MTVTDEEITFLDKPLTVERVLAAYKKTGLKPINNTFFRVVDGVDCACALGAVAVADGVEKFVPGLGVRLDLRARLVPFLVGFDGDEDTFTAEATNRAIYKLGVACREAVGL